MTNWQKYLTDEEQEQLALAEMLSRNTEGELDSLPTWVRAILWREIQAYHSLATSRALVERKNAALVEAIGRANSSTRLQTIRDWNHVLALTEKTIS